MKLERLVINRLPGINQPFTVEAAGAGFHVVFGPNGIGKSSICRAVERLYWDDRGPSQSTSLVGEFELDGEAWRAEREGSRLRWQHNSEDSRPPHLPASHNHHCFFLCLRDLIDPSPEGTQDIAAEIRRQMSGGFDLDRVTADLFAGVGARHGRRERNGFNSASKAVEAAAGKQLGLQRRADQLDALRAQLDAAESGARRLTSVDRALGLADRFQEHAGVAEKIATLPEGLAKLTGQEAKQVEQLQERLDKLQEEKRTLEGQRDTAREKQRDARLPAPLDQAEIEIWRENADELSRLELALQAARNERSASRKELAAALSAVGGGEVDKVNLDLADHGHLFEFLRAAEAHKATVNAIETKLRLLSRAEQPDDEQSEREKFRTAVDALRAWLRAPEPESHSARIRARLPWLLIAIALVVVGAGLAVFVEPALALLAAVGVGIAMPVIMLRSSGSAGNSRTTAQEAFGKLGIEAPVAWDIQSVDQRLRNLDSDIAAIDSRIQLARNRDMERESLNNDLDGLSATQTEINTRRQTLADSLKLDAIPPDAELVDFARALDQLRSARIKDEHAAGKSDDLAARYAELLSALAEVLERHGEPQPTDAQTAVVYLNSLADRNARLGQATAVEQQATARLEQVAIEHSADLNSIQGIYAEVGLDNGDLPGLTALLDSLPFYRDLKSTATRLDGQIELDQATLAKAGEAELAECDRPTLEHLQADLSRTAEEAPDLRNEIAEVNAQVNDAKHGSSLQDLIAAHDEARTTLRDRRDEMLFAKAGNFLIDAVEAEYEQTQLPRVFQRAGGHFSDFTHHNYELRLSHAAKVPRLFAIELRNNERRELDELSDGTRAQLLLAARIAFAEEVEQERTLPLFLDEALDQSDPARFEAIVRSLGRIAKDQERQIFYLTSDPLDVDRIRHALAEENCELAKVIDLGLIRTQAAGVDGPQALHVGPRPTVLTPDGKSAEEYGAALGVPQLAPVLGYEQQHFFHILSDDLHLLHNFLMNGLERVGQWKTVAGTALADNLCAGSISSQQIALRVDLLKHFCELWQRGRGRPVNREVLEDSGALSERYLDDVAAITDELDGNPERLLAALEEGADPRLRGFRRNSLENLEKYLQDNGYVDDQPVLGENDLRLRALASPAANELPEGVARDCLHRWWTWAARLSQT